MVDGSGNVRTEPTRTSSSSEPGPGPGVRQPAAATASTVPVPRRSAADPVPLRPVDGIGTRGEPSPDARLCDAVDLRPPRGRLRRAWNDRRTRATATRFPGWLRGADALGALDAATDAVLAMDEQGRCLFVNAAGARMFGRPVIELDGCDVRLLVPRLAVAVRSLVAERAAGQAGDGPRAVPGGAGVELAGIARNGSSFPAQVWLTPVTRRHRLIVLATIRDLSAQRAAAAATRALLDDVHELRAVVAGVTSAVTERAIVIVDGLGHITSFNRAAEKLIGRAAEEVVGRPLAELSDPDRLTDARAELRLAPGVDPLLELTRSGLANRQEWTFLNRDGDPRSVTLRITPIGDPHEPIGFVCVARERSATWEPLTSRPSSDRLLLDLDDAETRTLRWQVGGSGVPRRR